MLFGFPRRLGTADVHRHPFPIHPQVRVIPHMLKNLRFLVGCALFYAAAAPASHLLDIYELAKENDPVLREARERFHSTEEVKPQANALLLPTLSASAEADAVRDDVSGRLAGNGKSSYGQAIAQIAVSQPVYHRDYWIRLDQADHNIAQAAALLAAAEIDLMVRSTSAYFNVLAAADNLRTATAEKQANGRQLEQAQQRFDVGLVAITDVHEAQAAFDNAVANEITADNALSNAWEDLRKIVGPINKPLAKLGDKLPLRAPQPENVEQWADRAQQQNYEIIGARAGADASKQNIEIQNSGHYPTLDLVGAYSVLNSGDSSVGDRNEGVVGLQLKIPLYQGGAVTSRTRQARFDFQADMEVLDQKRREVNRQVRDGYRGVISSIGKVKALKSTVRSFTSALESTQAGLEVGTRTMVDVLTVTKSLYQAQRDYDRARYDYIINGLKLHQAASSLTPELLEKANEWLLMNETVEPPG